MNARIGCDAAKEPPELSVLQFREQASVEAEQHALPRIPSLSSNVVWTLIGSLTHALCQLVMLSVLAKWGSAALVGQFAIGLAVAAPVFMLTSLQLRAIQATDARSKYRFYDLFALRCISTIVALFVTMLAVVLFGYDHATSIVILLVAVTKAIESFSDVVAGLLQKHERLDQVAIAFVLKGLIGGLSFAAVFIFTRSLIASVVALAAGLLLVFLAYEARMGFRLLPLRERAWRLDLIVLRRLFAVSLPLGIVMALISLNINLPRYIVERDLGAAELGIFASLAYAVTVMNFVVNAIGQSAFARLARMVADRDFVRFRSLIKKMVIVGIGLGVSAIPAAMLFGKWALTLLYTPEYAEHVNLLMLLVATAGVSAAGSFLGFGMTAAHVFREQLPVIGASTFASFAFSLLLVPLLGLMGAGLALMISAVVSLIGTSFVLNGALRRAAKQP